MNEIPDKAVEIIDFWFNELKPQQWWNGGEDVDNEIHARFGAEIELALAGDLEHWQESREGRLALVLVLDQFTRNVFRGAAKAFAGDAIALRIVVDALRQGPLSGLEDAQMHFFLMPLMHSEDQAIHEWARPYFANLAGGQGLKSFDEHAEVVAQFGRYPSRNRALERVSTPEELEYLKKGGGWGQ